MRAKINLYEGDCLPAMRKMADNQYGLTIVDPPYGINVGKMAYTQENNRPVKQKNGSILRVKKLKYKHGEWDKAIPTAEYFEQLFRISENQIIWGVNHFNLDVGKGRIKWNKCVPEGVSFNNYEYAYCSLINKEVEFTYLWAGMFQGKSLSEPTIQQGNKKLNEKRIHPTHKPILLYKHLLKNYAKPGDTILDTHFGSLSIGIACWDAGYDLDAYEIDKDYFEAGKKRLENHKAQLQINYKL